MKRIAAISAVIVLILIVMNFYYFAPSTIISKNQGTVLDDNWYNALKWIDKNTEKCAVIATYWDPGHFITGLGRRPVVFDGAHQSDTLYFDNEKYLDMNEGDIRLEKYDNGIVQIINKAYNSETKDVTLFRARIKDIAISLFTSNESLALEYLKDYRQPECKEFYYIASSDLIGKSTWWTYFATWNPEGSEKPCSSELNKGSCYNYLTVGLGQARPAPSENAIVYTYPFGAQQSFLVYEINSTRRAFLQQGSQIARISNFMFFTQSQGVMSTEEGAEVNGILLQSPDKGSAIFMPPELQSSMFTRLMFFDGVGLQNFKLVNNWGGEVKLYKVTFPE